MRKKSVILTLEQEKMIVNDYLNYTLHKIIKSKYNISNGCIQGILNRNKIRRINDLKRIENRRKYKFDQGKFQNIDTEEKSYWLGYLMADGCVAKNMNTVSICSKDKITIEKFRSFIGDTNIPILPSKNCAGLQNQSVIKINSRKMCFDLTKHGCTPQKAYRIYIPNINKDLLNHFLRGYFDGDGCFYIRKDRNIWGNASITSCSNIILKQVQNLLKELNILRKNREYIRYTLSKNKKSKYGTINIGSIKEIVKFGDFLYNNATIFLQRKFERYLKFKNRPFRIKKLKAKSKYFGVTIHKYAYKKKWTAFLRKETIGNFYTEKDAAIAYNNKIIELGLPKEMLNIIKS